MKFAGPTAHGVLGSHTSLLVLFFPYISLIIGRRPGGPDLLEACMRPHLLTFFSTLEAPRFDLSIFGRPKTTSKKTINKNDQ